MSAKDIFNDLQDLLSPVGNEYGLEHLVSKMKGMGFNADEQLTICRAYRVAGSEYDDDCRDRNIQIETNTYSLERQKAQYEKASNLARGIIDEWQRQADGTR